MIECSVESLVDAFSEQVAVTDVSGNILLVNKGWREFGGRNGLAEPASCLGKNYLAALDGDDVSRRLHQGFEDVAAGRRDVFEVEYPCHSPTEKRWFVVTVSRLATAGTPLLLVAHKEVTLVKAPQLALQNVFLQTIGAIGSTIEKKDPYTFGHQRRVALLAARLGERLGLAALDVAGVWFGALIHDVGKIYVPSEVLNRPGRLNRVEFEFIKEHPEVGYDIVGQIDFPWPVAAIVREHHERLDGSGYPQGLANGDIILGARIVAVADVVEAMINHRPYRPALTKQLAIDELSGKRGVLYDKDAVDACLAEVSDPAFDFAALTPPFDFA